MSAAIVWLRSDLRLSDNPALLQALEEFETVVPVFVHAPDEAGAWAPGAASNWWLHRSLDSLSSTLRVRGSRLILRGGPSADALLDIARRIGAQAVFCNRIYEPALVARDRKVERALAQNGIDLRVFNGNLLVAPEAVLTKGGTPYRVFTPFWKSCTATVRDCAPRPAPAQLPSVPRGLPSVALREFGLLPRLRWYEGVEECWQPGEEGAQALCTALDAETLRAYPEQRDHPAAAGTTRLSPHLHFGEIGPAQVCAAVQALGRGRAAGLREAGNALLRQLAWREFAHYVLHHFPDTPAQPLDARFRGFPWQRPQKPCLRQWQRGQTGIPIVDAGMRELWKTGWMHNRVRMIVASFLTKHCRIAWLHGARWFWDTLVDADLANNTLNWQWVAGCGADAAPYFRIFNPVRQSERFDAAGVYLRRWLPELAELPDRWIHQPWRAPDAVLRAANITIGRDYPAPVIDLNAERAAALAAYRKHMQAQRTRAR